MQTAPIFRVAIIALCTIQSGDVLGLQVSPTVAQQHYRLSAPQSGATASASLTVNNLEVTDARGQVTVYLRDIRNDSADGQWLAYYNRGLNQIIRWPLSNSGNLQIGDLASGVPSYRASRMLIEPLVRNSNRDVFPPPMQSHVSNIDRGLSADPVNSKINSTLAGMVANPIFSALNQGRQARAEMLLLATVDPRGTTQYLTRHVSQSLVVTNNLTSGSDWWVAPAGQFVRIQHYQNGRVMALSSSGGHTVTLAPLAQDPSQLWRVSGFGADSKRFIIENARYGGNCLTGIGGQIALHPIRYAPTQLWIPIIAATPPSFQPFWKTVDQQVQVNAPLAPAEVVLQNSHRSGILILLNDRRDNSVQQIRIPAGQSATVTLDRDAGSTVVETNEIRSPSGVWDSQQFVTVIPPKPLYDLSVYEDFLQSIAIDRTGKSPNPIEDINVVPKSVGWIIIPPGDQLPQMSSIDVFPQAQAANNAGAVRRLDPRQLEKQPATNPLESILEEVKGLPRRGF